MLIHNLSTNQLNRLNYLNKFNLLNRTGQLNKLNQSYKLSQLRKYHLIQNKRNDRKLLTIKNANLETNRQLSSAGENVLLTVGGIISIAFIWLKLFGPNQVWFLDKMIDIKIKLFNLISKEKLEVVNEEYFEEIKDSKLDKMCEKKVYLKDAKIKKPKELEEAELEIKERRKKFKEKLEKIKEERRKLEEQIKLYEKSKNLEIQKELERIKRLNEKELKQTEKESE